MCPQNCYEREKLVIIFTRVGMKQILCSILRPLVRLGSQLFNVVIHHQISPQRSLAQLENVVSTLPAPPSSRGTSGFTHDAQNLQASFTISFRTLRSAGFSRYALAPSTYASFTSISSDELLNTNVGITR
jgi:hypothetical protein